MRSIITSFLKKIPNGRLREKLNYHKKGLRIILGTVTILLVGAFLLYPLGIKPESTPLTMPSLSSLIQDQSPDSPIDLDSTRLKNLPIGDVTNHPVENAWGTAVLIPQYHRYPGSDSDDTINDSAQKTQEQIYQILPQVSKEFETNLVMVEGELYGPVPPDKLEVASEKIKARNALVAESEDLKKILKKDGLSEEEKKLLNKCEKLLKKVDREIVLQGAPLKLKGEGKDIVLFGSENQPTREQSKNLVKKYIYLQDREKQLKGSGNKFSARDKSPSKLFSNEYISLLRQLSNTKDSLSTDLKKFEQQAKMGQQDDLLEVINSIQTTLQHLNKPVQPLKNITNKDTGRRSENPYKNINSPEKIEKMMNEAEQEIQEVVVEKRNQETADNFSKMLKTEQEKAGVVQYGAGHEEGLIKEFNKRGLSVVVVTPDEVLKRNSQLKEKS